MTASAEGPPHPARPARATRDDVARLAGVSTAVVSYVLNNGPRPVAPGTRERVLAAVRRLDYRPNSLARALRSQRSDSYGMLVPTLENPFFAALADAVATCAQARGRTVVLGSAARGRVSESSLAETFLARRVEAVITVGADHPDRLGTLIDAGVPVVAVDRDPGDPRMGLVTVDHRAGARAATAHLIAAHGYRRIGCVAGPVDLPVAQDRVLGWRSAVASAGLAPGPAVTADFTRRGGHAAARALLDGRRRTQRPLPRAVFVSSGQQAAGFLAAVQEAGVRVPDDLAVITFDGTEETRFTRPALSTVVQPVPALAGRALDLIRDVLRGREVARRVTVPSSLTLRRSCGCAPPGPAAPGLPEEGRCSKSP
ncbi:hypothetical protein ADL22_17685 [Streptomyces sp. NRRL F-4489]|uniref:LacI family DNA-binding transcriptional regulator n=1 Tax=Streptomyces sp. NRRL F-4489 TaxID=1609095 RepID=UPI000746253E|nr:LacI family DNA-binding transcriptional regulator [Streptomyces sp. NRRL F-4489]KUL38604.1 hypothetical protein ADL22_17685 [Streptomyces sp. NRRL F-4489]